MESGELSLGLMMTVMRSASLLQGTLVHTHLDQHLLGSSAQFLDLAWVLCWPCRAELNRQADTPGTLLALVFPATPFHSLLTQSALLLWPPPLGRNSCCFYSREHLRLPVFIRDLPPVMVTAR